MLLAETPVLAHRGERAVLVRVADRVRVAEEAEADALRQRPGELALALPPEFLEPGRLRP
jgi:hypothetical protein